MYRESSPEFVIKTPKGVFNIPSSTVACINCLQIDAFFVNVRDISVNNIDAVDGFAVLVCDGVVVGSAMFLHGVCQSC